MKSFLVVLVFLGCTLADRTPAGPQGALLVFPQSQPFYQSQNVQQQESLDKVSERVMERLLQEQGSERGNYHVYLADGRLQKVQYTAAPVRAASSNQVERLQQSSNSYSQYRQQESGYQSSRQQQGSSDSYSKVSYQGSGEGPNPVVAHFGRLQQEKMQQKLQQLRQQQEQLKQEEAEVLQQLQQQKEFASNYVATIQYTDVPPIPAPIYSQGPAPLTRVLRYAPLYY